MSGLVIFVTAHWGLISAIAVACISEALPYVKSTEANGILQLALGLLKGKQAPPADPNASQR